MQGLDKNHDCDDYCGSKWLPPQPPVEGNPRSQKGGLEAPFLVYATSGQERFAVVDVLNGPIILSMASLKTYQPQSYCCGHFLTQRTRHCIATLQPAYRL